MIAMFDKMKAEIPDVFYPELDPNIAPSYPFNFAAQPYPLTGNWTPGLFPSSGSAVPLAPFVLPLGAAVAADPYALFGSNSSFGAWQPPTLNGVVNPLYDVSYNLTGSGIMGASYSAASGIYKQLGYHPIGYDGSDNDNNGLVDDFHEGSQLGTDPTVLINVQKCVANHTHNTARSEMLYALLTQSEGAFGSVLNPDDLTSKEVADTDNDGLNEFVDAWGQPLQFFRWPVFYPSDIQFGTQAFTSPAQTRQQDSLDPNQQLLNPAWWWNQVNTQSLFPPGPQGNLSASAAAFQQYFHVLVDSTNTWDRSAGLGRRAYFTKPLILSGGRDKIPGVGILGINYPALNGNLTDGSGLPSLPANNSFNLIMLENQAAQVDPNGRMNAPFYLTPAGSLTDAFLSNIASTDDISNQNLQAYGGGIH